MIPKIIHSLWIGNLPPPTKWIKTWKTMNPDWEHIYWDNEKVFGRKWRNQELIDYYKAKAEEVVQTGQFKSARGIMFEGEKAHLFAWHIIADIVRYEILYEYGGYMAGADTICTKSLTENADWLDYELYTVNTGHLYADKYNKLKITDPRYKLLKNRYHPNNASPILASSKKNVFLKQIIGELKRTKKRGEAVDTTGNVFMGKMLTKYKPKGILIKPYYLKDDPRREDCYSRHFSGTTKCNYAQGR